MGQQRKLPNFLIIGAGKSGTTSAYHYLGQHPDVFMSPVKEPKFFALEDHPLDFRGPGDGRLKRGTVTKFEEYAALFEGVTSESAVGEASTAYLAAENAPERIAERLTGVRIVCLLRHPVDRAYSAYLYMRRDGWEPCETFESALDKEQERIEQHWYPRWHYASRGFYYRDLCRYYATFPKERIGVFLYEDFASAPVGTIQRMYRFLGVDDRFVPDVRTHHNVSGESRSMWLQRFLANPHPLKDAVKRALPKSLHDRFGHRLISKTQRRNVRRPPIPAAVRRRLLAAYRPDIVQLQDLIGRDLGHWLA